MNTPASLCPACGSGVAFDRMLFDDRYGYPGNFELARCAACGHRSLLSDMSSEQISDLYTRYYPRSSFDVEAWSPPREESGARMWWLGLKASAFRWVPRGVKVLDVGCGFGESLGYHRDRGCDAHGVEADRNILRVAQRHGLSVEVGLFDASKYEAQSFDVVTLDQVIEHVADPGAVLAGVHQVLKPGGQLILSTPNADGWGARVFGQRWIHWHTPYHLQFFTRESISRSAARAGFELERAVTVTNAAWLNFQWGHVITFPAPGQPSVYWKSGLRRTLAARVGLKFFHIINLVGLNVLITRVMDALGWGDNVVYLLRKKAA